MGPTYFISWPNHLAPILFLARYYGPNFQAGLLHSIRGPVLWAQFSGRGNGVDIRIQYSLTLISVPSHRGPNSKWAPNVIPGQQYHGPNFQRAVDFHLCGNLDVYIRT